MGHGRDFFLFFIFGERSERRGKFSILTECNILNTCARKDNGNFANHNLEKLCPWFLASSIPVLGLERVYSRKVGPWPRIF